MTSEYGKRESGAAAVERGQSEFADDGLPGYGSARDRSNPNIVPGQCPPWDEVNNPRGTDSYCDAGALRKREITISNIEIS